MSIAASCDADEVVCFNKSKMKVAMIIQLDLVCWISDDEERWVCFYFDVVDSSPLHYSCVTQVADDLIGMQARIDANTKRG